MKVLFLEPNSTMQKIQKPRKTWGTLQREGRGAKHSPSSSKLIFIVTEINIFQILVSGHIGDSDPHVWCFGQIFAASGRISMKLGGIVDQITTK